MPSRSETSFTTLLVATVLLFSFGVLWTGCDTIGTGDGDGDSDGDKKAAVRIVSQHHSA